MHSLRRHPDLTDLSGIGCAPSTRKNTALTDAPSYLIPRGDIQEARISRAKCTHRSKGTSSTQGASSFVLCPSPWSAVPRSLKPHGLHPPRPFAQDARLLRAKSRLGHRCHSFWKRRRCRARRLRTSEDCSVAPFALCNGVTSCMASSPLLECYTYNCPERKAHSVMLLHG
jgi:hypothetical protein